MMDLQAIVNVKRISMVKRIPERAGKVARPVPS